MLRLLFMIFLLSAFYSTGQSQSKNSVQLVESQIENKVDVLFDGQLFTSYIHPATIMKPVLWPVTTAKGTVVTRSYPLEKVAGERTDHPHHIGIWFNYGDVNGLDYWNNSEAIPAQKKSEYGRIEHQKVVSVSSKGNTGELVVQSQWIGDGHPQLDESTRFTFINKGAIRIIDRETTLTALEDISMDDNKEGMLGIRLAPELELPSDDEITLTDAHGNPTTVKGKNSRATADYLSSEGIRGGDVWGTRAQWMELSGRFGDEKVDVVIIDHPDNPGYPTYWHARGYGLFAANPLGQSALSGGKETLNFKIKKGEQITFRYRMIISDDPKAGKKTWNKLTKKFAKINDGK